MTKQEHNTVFQEEMQTSHLNGLNVYKSGY